MSIEREQQWITSEEFGRERRRLIEAGVPDDAPEFKALYERMRERNEHFFELYGRPYLATHPNKWIAIAFDGRALIRERSVDALRDGQKQFGHGNFFTRKLNDFGGHLLL